LVEIQGAAGDRYETSSECEADEDKTSFYLSPRGKLDIFLYLISTGDKDKFLSLTIK
jgi:hypothetical protein